MDLLDFLRWPMDSNVDKMMEFYRIVCPLIFALYRVG